MLQNKAPYHLTVEQISALSRIVGDHPELSAINLELSIAPTRHKINKVQNHVLKILTEDSQSFPLLLTDDEVNKLLTIDLPPEIRGALQHGL